MTAKNGEQGKFDYLGPATTNNIFVGLAAKKTKTMWDF